MTEEKPKARLEDWFYDRLNNRIEGKVYGHTKFEDGTEVRTSSVVYFDQANHKAVTRNTDYTLGKKLKNG